MLSRLALLLCLAGGPAAAFDLGQYSGVDPSVRAWYTQYNGAVHIRCFVPGGGA